MDAVRRETSSLNNKNHEVKMCENNLLNSDESKEILEDVEGFWGYMMCLGLSTVFVIGIGPMNSIGLLYEDFLESVGEVTKILSIAFGIGNAMVCFAAMMTTCALKKFSLRQVGLFGSVIYSVGSILAIFVYSISSFIIVNGFITPIGFGILMPISLTSFNTYFHKRRASMMAIVSVVVGAGGIVFPILVEKMMEAYGFRGTLALMCAINLHVIPGVAIMQPVEWHRTSTRISSKPSIDHNKNMLLKHLDENCNEEINSVNNPLIKSSHENKEIKHMSENDEEMRLTKSPSIASLGNCAGNTMLSEAFTKEGKWKGLIDFLDLRLFKDLVYCNLCLGITLAVFADITFFTLEPAILTSLGYNKIQIAYCITVGAITDLISRIVFAIASFHIKIKSRLVFFIGNFFMIVFRFAFIQRKDLNYLMIITGCLGFFRHWIVMNAPLVFADHFGIEKFPAAYGLNMLISGVANAMLGPLTGFIKSIWNDFTAVLYYLIVCSLLCFIPWVLEYVFKVFSGRKKNISPLPVI